MKSKIFLLMSIALTTLTALSENVDVIIFSRKRPLQFECLLDSFKRHCQGAANVTALVRNDGPEWAQAYESIITQYNFCNIVWQDDQKSFRPLLFDILQQCKSDHIMFLVDDDVFIDNVDLAQCVPYLEQNNAWCFTLRLGKHITYCFAQNMPGPPPPLTELNNEVRLFTFDSSSSDWGYPIAIEATIYRKHDVINDFSRLRFSNPNQLEALWYVISPKNPLGVCFETSKIINTPFNLVQDGKNRISKYHYSADELLDLFLQGKKLRFNCKPGFNSSPHVDIKPNFVK